MSNALGSIAVIYSSIFCLVSLQFEEDSEAKSIFTGGVTGALYKSSAGARRCAAGGAFGMGMAALWAFFLRKDDRVANYL